MNEEQTEINLAQIIYHTLAKNLSIMYEGFLILANFYVLG
jgi:hypothetical protein